LTSTVRMPLAKPLPGGPRTVEVIKTEEKGSDVNLATYLLAATATRSDTATRWLRSPCGDRSTARPATQLSWAAVARSEPTSDLRAHPYASHQDHGPVNDHDPGDTP